MVSSLVLAQEAKVSLRLMTVGDVVWSAQLHRAALQGFFVHLGHGFMQRYHRSFVESPHAVALVAESDVGRIGFAIGTLDDAAHYRHVVRRRGLPLAASACSAFLRRPRLLTTFLRTRLVRYALAVRRLGRRPAPGTVGGSASDDQVLVHLAVSDVHRGAGAGRVLVTGFELIVAGTGGATVSTLTTDATAFYESIGWEHAGTLLDAAGVQHQRFVREVHGLADALLNDGCRGAGGRGAPDR